MSDDLADKLGAILSDLGDFVPWQQVEPRLKTLSEIAITPAASPLYWVAPATVASLGKFVQLAQEGRHPILITGQGSKLSWGSPVKSPQLVVTTQKLNRIIDHALGDLTVTVEAGMTLQALQDYLAPYRQFLPLDPAYSTRATLGGIVATADAGSWRQRYGGVRDLLLGMSFVRADGAIAKAGGRVVKNVAGYDLMKLFTGSYGTLGILTELTFRLYPLPESSQTLVITGENQAISTFMQAFRKTGLSPTAAEVISSAFTQYLDLGEQVAILIRFQNLKETVIAQIQQTEALARSLSLAYQGFDRQNEADLWQRWKNRITDQPRSGEILAKIGVIPQQNEEYLQNLHLLSDGQGIASINLGSGVGKLRIIEEKSRITKLRLQAEANGGYLTLLEASPTLKQIIEPWGYRDNSLDLMQKIKQKFDPQRILNPGRFFS